MKKLICSMAMLACQLGMMAQHEGVTSQDEYIYDNMKVCYESVYNLNYDKYMMDIDDSTWEYRQIIPTTVMLPNDKAMLRFVDPVSFVKYNVGGDAEQRYMQVWEMRLNKAQVSRRTLYADVYNCKLLADGTLEKDGEQVATVTGGTDNSILRSRMEYMLNNSFVIESYQPGKKFYKTLGNNYVCIEDNGGLKVSSPWQYAMNRSVSVESELMARSCCPVKELGEPLGPTYKNVAATLSEHAEFSEFLSLLKACALRTSNPKDGWQAADQMNGNMFVLKNKGAVGAEDVSQRQKAVYLLGDIGYTLYVPTNEAMKEAYEMGLPTLDDLEKAAAYDMENDLDAYSDPESHVAQLREVMLNFVRYHIQYKSVFIDKGFESRSYLSGKLAYNKTSAGDYAVGAPYPLKVDVSETGLAVTDCRDGYSQDGWSGHTAHVVMKDGLYNLMANELWISSSSEVRNPYTCSLAAAPFVVIHAVDAPLIYADGSHNGPTGGVIPTQFEYHYYPVASDM